MEGKERDKVIKAIAKAANENKKYIRVFLERRQRNDPQRHKSIESFQKSLEGTLNDYLSDFNWDTEGTNKKKKQKDSIDILGKKKDAPLIIIEIDATRGDQIAKKLLSRLSLWGREKSKNIFYVALLYPDTQNGVNESRKFVKYGYDIMKKINHQSYVYGIYINGFDEPEIWDFVKLSEFMVTINGKEPKRLLGMNKCACYIIDNYTTDRNVNFKQLEKVFGRFVSNTPTSSHKKLKDKDGLFVYNQWREDDIATWEDFKEICKKYCKIEKVWK